MDINQKITEELGVKKWQVDAAVSLIDEGNTIPFIARYRKEATGTLDDEQLRTLFERLTYLRGLEEKKEQVLGSIEEQGKLTDELKAQILAAETLVVVEDLYRPYRPKRRTRASIAKEKGLEPLAALITLQKADRPLEELAAEYVDCFKKMEEAFGIPNDMTVSALAKLPEVLTMDQVPEDEERLWEILSGALKGAAESLVHSREIEGEHLRRDLLEKLDYMEGLVDFIEERAPAILKEYRARLEDKVKELLDGSAIDEGRIAAEVVIYADKICVDEETVRLTSHIDSTRKELMQGESVGRKLDFIAQEMNREANTILSKSSDPAISDQAIALKTEIEKIREQIQNIE